MIRIRIHVCINVCNVYICTNMLTYIRFVCCANHVFHRRIAFGICIVCGEHIMNGAYQAAIGDSYSWHRTKPISKDRSDRCDILHLVQAIDHLSFV